MYDIFILVRLNVSFDIESTGNKGTTRQRSISRWSRMWATDILDWSLGLAVFGGLFQTGSTECYEYPISKYEWGAVLPTRRSYLPYQL